MAVEELDGELIAKSLGVGDGFVGLFVDGLLILLMVQKSCTTWDGAKTLEINGINYQPQLVSRISEPSTVFFV